MSPAQDTTSRPKSRLEAQKENDAKNAQAHDITREIAFKEQIKEQATHLVNVLETEVAKMAQQNETSSTQTEIIQNFSNYSSELLQNLNEATNPILTPDLKQDLEQWVQTGNTLVNIPIENQFDTTNLEQMNHYIKQGLNFASKIGTEILGTHSSVAEESLLNGLQLENEDTSHSHKNSNNNSNYSASYAADTSSETMSTGNMSYTSTGADINMFSILANVLASMSQMSLNSVVTQVGLNTNYSKFTADIQDLLSIMTQISAAFKTAAANAALINSATNSLNIGFNGKASVGTNTQDASNYDGIKASMDGQNTSLNGPSQSWNIAQLLTSYQVSSTISGSTTNYKSNEGNYQSPSWTTQVFTVAQGANPSTDIFFEVGTEDSSAFIQKYAKTMNSIQAERATGASAALKVKTDAETKLKAAMTTLTNAQNTQNTHNAQIENAPNQIVLANTAVSSAEVSLAFRYPLDYLFSDTWNNVLSGNDPFAITRRFAKNQISINQSIINNATSTRLNDTAAVILHKQKS